VGIAVVLLPRNWSNNMYRIFMSLASATFIYIGASHVDGGWLFILALIAGGVYLGHVLTDALNDSE
jgi:hypothetical protein